MRKLFLTSVAAIVLDKVIPLLPKEPKDLKVAFIPTAAEAYEDTSWLAEDRNKLIDMGFNVVDVSISDFNKESLISKLENFDVIFVSGGNTFYLLQEARKSGFDEIVKDLINKGVLYIGSSAGSVLLAPTISYVKDFDDPEEAPELDSHEGLNMIDFLILPHAGHPKYMDTIKNLEKIWTNKGYKVKPLTNEQAFIVEGDSVSLVQV